LKLDRFTPLDHRISMDFSPFVKLPALRMASAADATLRSARMFGYGRLRRCISSGTKLRHAAPAPVYPDIASLAILLDSGTASSSAIVGDAPASAGGYRTGRPVKVWPPPVGGRRRGGKNHRFQRSPGSACM